MTRISTDKLLRKPYLGSKVFFWCSDAQYLDSPDKNYYLTFSHFNEPHMGLTVSLFNLVNKHNEIVEKFESLTAFGAGDGAHWSEDSKFFSLPIWNRQCDFIYDIEKKAFAMIPFANFGQIPNRNEKNFLDKIDLNKLIWRSIDETANL